MAVKYLIVLFASQLAGEALGLATDAPIPGPVIGMALLFLGLVVRGSDRSDSEGLDSTVRGLLDNLGLLFVPAGVGVMVHLPRLGDEYPAIAAALILGTALTIAVTGLVMAGMLRVLEKGKAP